MQPVFDSVAVLLISGAAIAAIFLVTCVFGDVLDRVTHRLAAHRNKDGDR